MNNTDHRKTSRVLLTLLVALAATAHAQAATDSQELSGKLAKAEKLIDAGKARAASVMLRDIIRSRPDNAEAHMQLGAALAALTENDNYVEAIAEEEKAIKLDSNSAGARRILGMIYANQRKHDDAINLLNEACKLNPNSFAAHRDLSKAYMAAGRIDDAVTAQRKAIDLKPDNYGAHSKLAVILAKKGDTESAIIEAKRAIDLGGKHAETHLLLANILLDSGDSAGSIEPFKDAIAANGYDALGCLNPLTAANALSGLGWALAAKPDATNDILDESLRYQKKAIKAHPGFLTAHIRTAQLLARRKRTKEAATMFQNLFKASHQEPTVGIAYAKFLTSSGKEDEARNILKKALEVSPENKQVSDELAKFSSANK